MAVDGAIGRTPPKVLLQDAYNLRGRAGRVLPLECRRQIQHFLRRAWRDLPCWRQQGVEASPRARTSSQRSTVPRVILTGLPNGSVCVRAAIARTIAPRWRGLRAGSAASRIN